ncbi:hypothetical protein KO481_22305 [Nocardia sp. NEAU-G5]|uniref:Uncharacterized protein n=1 Tax=Nocardia albiluteola TaxID=2842303 RepID=A0ABS6B293_9NOCA|nr:hypothetical protein [Nocardia albiluteola]MBU3064253.1 hypothetical protein [Nocardia albiluteola]
MTVELAITQVWDLPSREALLVTGPLTSGKINQGTVLRNATAGAEIAARGLELQVVVG